jgi:four helix bundle protein
MVVKQLARAGASVGANLIEADHAFSRADFCHRCSVALKEAAESHYWLRMSAAAGLLKRDELEAAIVEADQLVRILKSIVKKMQRPEVVDSGGDDSP